MIKLKAMEYINMKMDHDLKVIGFKINNKEMDFKNIMMDLII
jgi:hypothetical protein